jgi:hypothetical protein
MSSRSGSFMRMLVFAVVIVVLVALATNMIANPPPKVEITDCSLTSDNVQSGSQTALSINMQSNDASIAHDMRVELSSHQLVSFFMNSQPLQQYGTIWYYERILDTKSTLKNQIDIRPMLESGISQITYRINVAIYLDGTQVFTKNLDMTVNSP